MANVGNMFADGEFDPATVELLASAYEIARKSLHDKGQPPLVQEIIADRIIEAAKNGERDPEKLCEKALTALGNKAVFER